MSNNRQERRFENLSAYLDGELNNRERREIEILLQNDASFRDELKHLEATHRLLRQAPHLKVPHNFTLTAAMLPQKKRVNLWVPVMSASSALAAILLVFTYLISYSVVPAAAPMMMQSNAMNETAAEESTTAGQEPPMIIQWFGNALAQGKGGGGDSAALPEAKIYGEEAQPAMAAAMPDEMEAALPQPTPTVSAMDLGGIEVGSAPEHALAFDTEGQADQAVDETTRMQATVAPMEEPVTQHPDPSALILGIAPTEERGQIIEEPAAETYALDQVYQEPASPFRTIRWVLLIISLSCAGFAIFLRRRHS
jgi:hypothetical protein